jgi:hypothetical protein
LAGAAAVVLLLCGVETARACRTPVYRYAMYNWDAAPLRLFYFHGGQPAAEDQKVNAALTDLAAGNPPGANLSFDVIDASNAKGLEDAPGIVVDAWKKRGEAAGPVHFVYAPWAVELFAGRLDEKAVKALFNSPARTKVGELLKEGNAAVLLLLTGPDDEANQRAEKTVAAVVADAAAGKILAAPPDDPPFDDPADEPEDAPKPVARKVSVAVLKVAQTDPAEAWLVRTLLAVEPDLEKYKKEPMVFAVFGRGRALPPLVGKGITADELTGALEFLSGPCSCQVKDQCPGFDLPMQWDWHATAEALAADDDDFRPRGPGFAGMGDEPRADIRPPKTAAEPVKADPDGAGVAQATARLPAEAGAVVEKRRRPAAESSVEKADSSSEPACPLCAEKADDSAESFAAQQSWRIGLIVGAATVVVILAGFALLRLQRPG